MEVSQEPGGGQQTAAGKQGLDILPARGQKLEKLPPDFGCEFLEPGLQTRGAALQVFGTATEALVIEAVQPGA